MEEDEGRGNMQLDYFYGSASEHFRFYQIPALLLEEDCYRKLRDTSKLLYGVLLSQLSLSRKNGWMEPETGRIYIHYNLRNLAQCLGHSANTITRAMEELCEAGLLRRRRRGRGLPDILYVMDFTTAKANKESDLKKEETGEEEPQAEGQKIDSRQETEDVNGIGSEKPASTGPEMSLQKGDHTEKTDKNTEISVTEIYRDILEKQVSYSYLLKNHPLDAELINEILFVMVDAFTTQRKYLRVNGDNREVNEVQNRLKRIDASHIEYILRCMKESAKKIVNPPLFLLTALYNAPATINTYYNALAAHDMSRGVFAGYPDNESPTAGNNWEDSDKGG